MYYFINIQLSFKSPSFKRVEWKIVTVLGHEQDYNDNYKVYIYLCDLLQKLLKGKYDFISCDAIKYPWPFLYKKAFNFN